jgi:hypothetical protein
LKNLYLVFTIVFLLLSLAGGVFLVKNNQDNRNQATGCWATCNCCGTSFCANPSGSGCNSECNSLCGSSNLQNTPIPQTNGSCDSSSASACVGQNPGNSCTGGFPGTCQTTSGTACACVANNSTVNSPTPKPGQTCVPGNLGILCCQGSVACQQHRDASCNVTCADNCGIFNNSVCTAPSAVTPTLIPGGGGVTWNCTALSGSRNGFNCSGGYQNCSGYRSGTPCAPGEYIGGQLQAPVNAITCHCSNDVWIVGKGASCDGLCACTNNVCTTCSVTASPVKTSTPTPTNTSTPTNTPKPTLTPTGTLAPTSTPTPTGTLTPTNTPTNTPVPTNTPINAPTSTPAPTQVLAQGPSPTRIILPSSGVEFPAQALSLIGIIVTLAGFLILL